MEEAALGESGQLRAHRGGNQAPWAWVRSDDLISAMRTFDTVEKRGYVLVSEVE